MMHSSYSIPGLLLLILCTAGCSGVMEETFTLPAATSGPPLTALWEGAVAATGIKEESGMMSGFDLIMEEDGHIVRMNLVFSGVIDGERRHFNAYYQQDGTVSVTPTKDRALLGIPHPDQVFKDLEAVGPGGLYGEGNWTIRLNEIRGVTYAPPAVRVYLMENRTLTPLEWVSTAGAASQVFYLSVCKVPVPDETVTTEHGVGAGIEVGTDGSEGRCSILFTPEELAKTSYKSVKEGGKSEPPGRGTKVQK